PLKEPKATSVHRYEIAYQYSIRSSASLLSPYGFDGFLGWSSSIEGDCALPYTAAEEENTNLRMPAVRIVSSMAMPEATFESKNVPGLVTDSAMSALAAK